MRYVCKACGMQAGRHQVTCRQFQVNDIADLTLLILAKEDEERRAFSETGTKEDIEKAIRVRTDGLVTLHRMDPHREDGKLWLTFSFGWSRQNPKAERRVDLCTTFDVLNESLHQRKQIIAMLVDQAAYVLLPRSVPGSRPEP